MIDTGEPKPDGALIVGIAELRGKVGAVRDLRRQVELEPLRLDSAHVSTERHIRLELEMEMIADGLSVRGSVESAWVGECRRCLDPVAGEVVVEMQEIFETNPTEGDTYRLGWEVVDLEPSVRDVVMLALPLTPLCGEDCVGPDPERFPTTVATEHEPSDEAEPTRDPRWAALDDFDVGGD